MKNKRQHVHDTDNPQMPCCWMARKAELAAMPEKTPDNRTPEQKKADLDASIDLGWRN
jgi:hypothetical protein